MQLWQNLRWGEGVGVTVHYLDRSTCQMHIVHKNNQAAVDLVRGILKHCMRRCKCFDAPRFKQKIVRLSDLYHSDAPLFELWCCDVRLSVGSNFNVCQNWYTIITIWRGNSFSVFMFTWKLQSITGLSSFSIIKIYIMA